MKFTSVEHEVIFNKLYDKLKDDSNNVFMNEEFTPSSDTQKNLAEIHKYIKLLLQTRENHAYRQLTSHRKVLGRPILFAKKVIRKLLKWYIEPITLQQTEFNNTTTSAIGKTTELITELVNKISDIQSLYDKSVVELNNKENQYNELKIQMNYKQSQYDIISGKIEHLQNEIYEKISNLEKNHIIYSENIESVTTRLRKLDEIEIFNDNEFNIFNKNTYSQSGEDSILAYIIYVLGIPFESITYIDMGANHAKEMSNTYFFYCRGAKGILVEANSDLIPELKFYRHRDLILNNCVDISTGNIIDFYILNGDGLSTPDYNAALDFCKVNPQLEIVDKRSVTTISYKTIIEEYLGKAPTILSIDIEGKDLEILRSIDLELYRPLLIVTEMIRYDTKLNFKTKNEEVKTFLNSMEYDEYAFTGINSIFVDRRFLKERNQTKG